MKIVVTQQDIIRGRRDDAHSCPVALAVDRAASEANPEHYEYCEVLELEAGLHDDNKIWHRFNLPAVATAFIQLFDAGLPVEPFEFDLPVE